MRGTIISNCFHLIQLLDRSRGVSIDEIARELNVTKRTAYRYINAASPHITVWQTRIFPKRYKLLKEADFEQKG